MKQFSATLDVRYLDLMAAFMNHNSGCSWLVSTGNWSNILNIVMNSATNSAIANEGYKFVAKLIQESFPINPAICSNILNKMMSSLIDAGKLIEGNQPFDEKSFLENCSNHINLLDTVLERLLEGHNLRVQQAVVEYTENYEFEKFCLTLCDKIASDEAAFKISNILFLLSFLDYQWRSKMFLEVDQDEMFKYNAKFKNLRKNLLLKRSLRVYMKLLLNWVRYCKAFAHVIPKLKSRNGEVLLIQDQIVYYQLHPLFYLSIKTLGVEFTYYGVGDELRNRMVSSHFKRMSYESVYHFFNLQRFLDQTFTFEDIILVLEYINKSSAYYSRNQANIILDYCVYFLEDASILIKEDSTGLISSPTKMRCIAYLMQTIATFITEFDFNWQDTLESVTLMEITLTVISTPEVTNDVSCFAVRGVCYRVRFFRRLQIINLCLDYLAPIFVLIFGSYWSLRDRSVKR